MLIIVYCCMVLMLEMPVGGREWSRMVGNGLKWMKVVENGGDQWRMCQNGWELLIIQNNWECFRMGDSCWERLIVSQCLMVMNNLMFTVLCLVLVFQVTHNFYLPIFHLCSFLCILLLLFTCSVQICHLCSFFCILCLLFIFL